ncbi:hypothetical protein U3A55_14980 [Salarchaeum sp. III]|uniref:hypothetical protein n=1 Tax=Salarchaeum sp. III TaxID=3107927 RepID=UPI002EDA542E
MSKDSTSKGTQQVVTNGILDAIGTLGLSVLCGLVSLLGVLIIAVVLGEFNPLGPIWTGIAILLGVGFAVGGGYGLYKL